MKAKNANSRKTAKSKKKYTLRDRINVFVVHTKETLRTA
jgi:hypothetical protein